jgi:hypothetical protein
VWENLLKLRAYIVDNSAPTPNTLADTSSLYVPPNTGGQSPNMNAKQDIAKPISPDAYTFLRESQATRDWLDDMVGPSFLSEAQPSADSTVKNLIFRVAMNQGSSKLTHRKLTALESTIDTEREEKGLPCRPTDMFSLISHLVPLHPTLWEEVQAAAALRKPGEPATMENAYTKVAHALLARQGMDSDVER